VLENIGNDKKYHWQIISLELMRVDEVIRGFHQSE